MSKPIIGIGSDINVTPGKRERAFVYNTYVESLKRAGAVPVLIPPQPENAADLVSDLDGILLAGGDDCDPELYGEERHPSVEPMDPRRQTNDVTLAGLARERGIPTLGICLGVQVMNVVAGGTLIQDLHTEAPSEIEHVSEPEDRARHEVIVEHGTKLEQILARARSWSTPPTIRPSAKSGAGCASRHTRRTASSRGWKTPSILSMWACSGTRRTCRPRIRRRAFSGPSSRRRGGGPRSGNKRRGICHPPVSLPRNSALA